MQRLMLFILLLLSLESCQAMWDWFKCCPRSGSLDLGTVESDPYSGLSDVNVDLSLLKEIKRAGYQGYTLVMYNEPIYTATQIDPSGKWIHTIEFRKVRKSFGRTVFAITGPTSDKHFLNTFWVEPVQFTESHQRHRDFPHPTRTTGPSTSNSDSAQLEMERITFLKTKDLIDGQEAGAIVMLRLPESNKLVRDFVVSFNTDSDRKPFWEAVLFTGR